MSMIFAGVGARWTPTEVCELMERFARWADRRGWILRTGDASPADLAFGRGASTSAEVYTTDMVREATQGLQIAAHAVAAEAEPKWDERRETEREYLARNSMIVYGKGLDLPIDILVCWTPEAHRTVGTGHIIRLAERSMIPVVNLGAYEEIEEMRQALWRRFGEEYEAPPTKLTRVVNRKSGEPYDVYIGRPSRWGNPFKAGKDGTRAEVIAKYKAWVRRKPDLMADLHELKGKTLGCWCAPKACHGDVLAELADQVKLPLEIFVFGSNLAGRHGRGAALSAKNHYGASYGVGIGRTGNAYAIPTKGLTLEVLPLKDIRRYVDDFIDYAWKHQDLKFLVTRVGCGLAGYKDEQIAPMFRRAPNLNVVLPNEWKPYI